MADERPYAKWIPIVEALGLNELIDHQANSVSIRTSLQIVQSLKRSITYFACSKDGYILACDESFRALFGFDETCAGQTVQDALATFPVLSTLIDHTLQQSKGFISRIISIEQGHQSVDLLIDAYPIQDGIKITGYTFTFKTLHDIVALDTQMALRDKINTIAKMSAGVSHEIRNPLTSVMGFLQIVLKRLETLDVEQERTFLDMMAHELEHITSMTDDLLVLARAGHSTETILHVDELLSTLFASQQGEDCAQGIDFVLSLNPVPLILADEKELSLAFGHLIQNANEAIEDNGTITVRTSFDPTEGRVRVDVMDTGPGIPNYMMDRIFDVFFTTKGSHFGLGLPITQRIVTDMGGEIRVSSKGHGTTFSLLLPPAARG